MYRLALEKLKSENFQKEAYVCPFCMSILTEKVYLREHIERHHCHLQTSNSSKNITSRVISDQFNMERNSLVDSNLVSSGRVRRASYLKAREGFQAYLPRKRKRGGIHEHNELAKINHNNEHDENLSTRKSCRDAQASDHEQCTNYYNEKSIENSKLDPESPMPYSNRDHDYIQSTSSEEGNFDRKVTENCNNYNMTIELSNQIDNKSSSDGKEKLSIISDDLSFALQVNVHKKQINLENYLLKYGIIIESEKIVLCQYCQMKFANIGFTIKHIQTKHDAKILNNSGLVSLPQENYLCALCVDKFCTYEQLHEHMQYFHRELRPSTQRYTCFGCKDEFYPLDAYREHILSCYIKDTLRCYACQKLFNGKNLLNRHQSICTGPHFCLHCWKKFSCQKELNRHIIEHHLVQFMVSKNDVACPKCPYSFRNSIEFGNHMQSKHAYINEVKTKEVLVNGNSEDDVDFSSFKKQALVASDSDDSQEDNCMPPMSFNENWDSMSTSDEHITNLENWTVGSELIRKFGEKIIPVWRCRVCELEFKTRLQLSLHIECKHMMNPFKCTICKQNWGDREVFRDHVTLHKGKPHTIKNILFSMSSPSVPTFALQLISTTRNDGIRNYLCSVCQYETQKQSNIRRHVRNHLPSLVRDCYICNFCGGQYSDNEKRRYHMQRCLKSPF